MTDFRCQSHLHGILNEEGLIEIKCRWGKCAKPGVVVIHCFDPLSGNLVKTKEFREPSASPPNKE